MQVKFGLLFWFMFIFMFLTIIALEQKVIKFEKKITDHFMFIEKELKLIK